MIAPAITVRRFHLHDARPCREVFYEAVHQGAAAHYSKEQRQAWAPSRDMPPLWPDRLADQITYVGHGAEGIEGFFTLNHDGHLDLAFVRARQMGRGLAGRLYDACFADPAARDLTGAYTEASHLSRPFFLRRGWRVIARQEIERFGVYLTNFRMDISL